MRLAVGDRGHHGYRGSSPIPGRRFPRSGDVRHPARLTVRYWATVQDVRTPTGDMATDHAGTVERGPPDTESSAYIGDTIDFLVLFVLVTGILLSAAVVMIP